MPELINLLGQSLLRLDGPQVLNLRGQAVGRWEAGALRNSMGQMLAEVADGCATRAGQPWLEVREGTVFNARGQALACVRGGTPDEAAALGAAFLAFC